MLGETLPRERRHAAGLAPMLRRFGRLLGERAFLANGVAMNLAFAAFFAYISASSFVLEDIYHVSPQLFSVAFGLSSAMFIVVARGGARALPRFGAERLFAFGLRTCGLATLGVLVTVLAGWGPVALVGCVCAINASLGLVWPNGTAVSMADSGELAGSASALLGLEQFGFAAIVAPLVGIAGSRTAVPTGIVMLACGGGAVLVHAARGRRPPAPARRRRRRPTGPPPLTYARDDGSGAARVVRRSRGSSPSRPSTCATPSESGSARCVTVRSSTARRWISG